MFTIAAITFTAESVLIGFLIYRCVKVCKGKPKQQDKRRAGNGMVVGDEDDFDDIRQSDPKQARGKSQGARNTA